MRAWDGLIAIVSTPANRQLATQIFRGQLVGGRHLVGAWRFLDLDAGVPPLEGPFLATKME